MLKLTAAVFFIFCGGYMGITKSKAYKKRIQQLELSELLFIRIKTYISSQRLTTAEIFSRLAATESLKELRFIALCFSRLKDSCDFPEIWRAAIDESKTELSLKDQDYIPIYQLAELLGSMDSDGIISGLELSLALLKQAKKEAIEDCETNGRLVRSLYTLSGVAAAILIF